MASTRLKTPSTRRVQVQSTFSPTVVASPSLRGHAYNSPSLATPGTTIPINDDAAERRQRRLDTRTHAAASPSCHTPTTIQDSRKTVESGTATFTNAQISEHYSMCVQLSAENKINSKNAFGLRLIDYMQEILSKRGEMTNFQVAGCTIDASAKIYAGRVDSIYNDAHKVLGGLVRSDQPEQEGNEGGGEQQPQQSRRRTKKTMHTVPTLEKNLKSLDVNTFDLEFEVDPLFKQTCASFDEGGVQGLLLNQLHVDSDNCLLMLDPNQVPPLEGSYAHTDQPVPGIAQLAGLQSRQTKLEETATDHIFSQKQGLLCTAPAAKLALQNEPVYAFFYSKIAKQLRMPGIVLAIARFNKREARSCMKFAFDVPCPLQLNSQISERGIWLWEEGKPYDYFKSIKDFDTLPISATFADFKFNRTDNEWDIGTLLTTTSLLPHHTQPAVDYTLMEPDLPLGDADYDDSEPAMTGDTTMVNTAVEVEPVSVLGECGDGRVLETVTRQQPHSYAQLAHTVAGELCLTDVLELSEYSYYNPNILSTWAGPQHWKLRPRNRDPTITTGESEKDEKIKKKKKQIKQPFRVIMDTVPDTQLFKKGRGGNKLAKSVVSTSQAHRYTLPVDSHTDQSLLFALFLRPKWKIKRQRRLTDPLEDKTDGAYYDYNNPNDEANYCPVAEVPGNDSDDDPGAPLPAEDWGEEGTVVGGSQFMAMLSDTQATSDGVFPPDSQEPLTGTNLVPMPKKVAQIRIDYARHAKRLDVKKLKTKMWEVISENLSTKDAGSLSLQFSKLCSTVNTRVSASTCKELSIPISFVCFLHLVNEKSLKINAQPDMLDFTLQLPD